MPKATQDIREGADKPKARAAATRVWDATSTRRSSFTLRGLLAARRQAEQLGFSEQQAIGGPTVVPGARCEASLGFEGVGKQEQAVPEGGAKD